MADEPINNEPVTVAEQSDTAPSGGNSISVPMLAERVRKLELEVQRIKNRI